MGMRRIGGAWAIVACVSVFAVSCGGADSDGLFNLGNDDSAEGGAAGSDNAGGASGSGHTGGTAGSGAAGEGGGSGSGGHGGDDCTGADCPPSPCSDHSECASTEFCNGETCEPDLCTPGVSGCSDNVRVTCNEIGNGGIEEPCDGERTCQQSPGGAACVPWACRPGGPYCEGSLRIECSGDGLTVLSERDCMEDGVPCEQGECAPPVEECPPDQPGPAVPCSGFARACTYGGVTCTCWGVWSCGQ